MHTIECTQSLSVLIESIEDMTLSPVYTVPVTAWLNTDNNMTEECSGQARQGIKNELTTIDRREKDQKFKNLDKDARLKKYRNGKQIENLLKGLLLANRNGLIQPEKTKHGQNEVWWEGKILFKGRDKRHQVGHSMPSTIPSTIPSTVKGERKNFEPHMY